MPLSHRLIGRYEFVERLRPNKKSAVWRARDTENDGEVLVGPVPSQRAELLEPLVGWDQPHVAPILALVRRWDRTEVPAELCVPSQPVLVVAAYLGGRTLHQRLQAGPLDPARAVQWTERLADALTLVHAAGGVHGAVSPRAVVVSRVHLGLAPVLTHLISPPVAACCSPERMRGEGPSPVDDVWGLAVVLYTALARETPFSGRTREELTEAILRGNPKPIEGADPELMQVVLQGLSPDVGDRFSEASALAIALRDWMFRHGVVQSADSESMAAKLIASATAAFPVHTPASAISTPVSEPPSEARPSASAEPSLDRQLASIAPPDIQDSSGQSARPPATSLSAQRTDPPRRMRPARSRWPWQLALGLLVLGLALWLGTLRSRAPSSPETVSTHSMMPAIAPKEAVAEPATASGAGHEGAPPPGSPPSPKGAMDGETNPAACMEAFLPERTFGRDPDLGFVCQSRDLWRTARRLLYRVSREGSGEGMMLWGHLGRYELPALAILRARCCPGAEPFETPVPSTPCGSLTAILTEVARDPTDERVDEFYTMTRCLLSRRVHSPQSWHRAPPRTSREYFDEFVEGVRTGGGDDQARGEADPGP